MSRTFANLLLLTAGAVWGMGFVAQQTAMDDIGPMVFIALRFFVATLAVLPFAVLERKRNPQADRPALTDKKIIFALFLLGSVFFAAMAFQQLGLMTTTVTNAGFLTALYVILVPLFLLIFIGDRPQFVIWPAAAIALFGIFLLSGGELAKLTTGDWLTIVCAGFWAWHVILTGRIGALTQSPVSMACAQFFVAGMLAAICHFLSGITPWPEAFPTYENLLGALPEILYAGAIAGGLAFTLQAIGQRYTSAAAAAIFLSSESLFAAAFGAIFLNDLLPSQGYIGCALIFIAILIAELAPILNEKSKSKPI